MCIIAYSPVEAKEITEETFHQCAKSNSDGLGMMWASDGELHTWKSLEGVGTMIDLYKRLRERETDVALHFRAASAGPVTEENCHPFLINPGVGLMHNGTLRYLKGRPDDMTDTEFFVKRILSVLPADWMNDPNLWELVKGYSRYGNKFLLMDYKGRVYIMHKSQGYEHEGNWFSNYGFRRNKWTSRNAYSSSYHSTKRTSADPTEKKSYYASKKTTTQKSGDTRGYLYKGSPVCATCLPDELIETADDVFLSPSYCVMCTQKVMPPTEKEDVIQG